MANDERRFGRAAQAPSGTARSAWRWLALLTALVVGAAVTPAVAAAVTFEAGQLAYASVVDPETDEEVTGEVKVTGYAASVTSISTLEVPETVTDDGTPYTVREIGDGSLRRASATRLLTSVSLPDTLRRIGERAFQNNALTAVDVPATVVEIGSGAFQGNKITGLELPWKGQVALERIGANAFRGNPLAGVIEIPWRVTEIGPGAFLSTADDVPGPIRFNGAAPTVTTGRTGPFAGEQYQGDGYGALPSFGRVDSANAGQITDLSAVEYLGTEADSFATPTWQGYAAQQMDVPVPPPAQATIVADGPLRVGGTFTLKGEGWTTIDHRQGSTIGVKIDDGQFAQQDEDSWLTTWGLWAFIEADDDGTFEVPITLPDGTNDVFGGTSTKFRHGKHWLRLLTGSLKAPIDEGRSIRVDFTVEAVPGAYKSNLVFNSKSSTVPAGSQPIGGQAEFDFTGPETVYPGQRVGPITTRVRLHANNAMCRMPDEGPVECEEPRDEVRYRYDGLQLIPRLGAPGEGAPTPVGAPQPFGRIQGGTVPTDWTDDGAYAYDSTVEVTIPAFTVPEDAQPGQELTLTVGGTGATATRERRVVGGSSWTEESNDLTASAADWTGYGPTEEQFVETRTLGRIPVVAEPDEPGPPDGPGPGPTPDPPVDPQPQPQPQPQPDPPAGPGPSAPSVRIASIAGWRTAQAVDRKRRVRVATVRCPAGDAACRVTVPKRVTVKIRGKRYRAAVVAPSSVKAGKAATVRLRLPAAAVTALRGRKATVRVTVSVTSGGKKATRTVKATLRGAKVQKAKAKR